MKKTKILVPALAVLALGMAASVTGTVAWFTTTAIANANGIAVNSIVPSSLYIKEGLIKSADAASLSEDSVTHTAHANPLSPAHMTFATNVLTASEAATYVAGNEAGQSNAGLGATWTEKGTLTGAKDGSNTATISGSTYVNDYLAFYQESLVRKQSGSSEKFSLNATVTISGIDGTDALEKYAYNTIRVGFLYSVDDGTTWYWSTKQLETDNTDPANLGVNRNSGRPETLGSALGNTNNETGVYCTNWNFMGGQHGNTDATKATTNSVFNVIPVVWLEGEDSDCYAINFQNAYNWSISIQYKIA